MSMSMSMSMYCTITNLKSRIRESRMIVTIANKPRMLNGGAKEASDKPPRTTISVCYITKLVGPREAKIVGCLVAWLLAAPEVHNSISDVLSCLLTTHNS